MSMSANPSFELLLLGDFSLRRRDRSPGLIPISSKKARALLAYVRASDD
jgi:hypothetical protein